MTHHESPPQSPRDLRVGDTVSVFGAASPTGKHWTTVTPCCARRVIVKRDDISYMARREDYAVTRYCAGCGWPYEVRVPLMSAPSATFTVRPAPRHYTKH